MPALKKLDYNKVKDCIISSSCDKINAETLSEEDVDFAKKVIYDVVVKCKLPDESEQDVLLIFDLEMQRRYDMNYSVVSRAVYYASRLLAKQLSKKQSYNELRPVYSAWICMRGVPVDLRNTVCSFRFEGTNSKGKDISSLVKDSQLINIDLLLLSEKYDWDTEDDTVIKFLQSIFKNKLQDNEFNPYIKADRSLQEEVQLLMSKEEEYQEELRLERKEAREEGQNQGILKTKKIFKLSLQGMSEEQIADELGLPLEEVIDILSD